MMKAKLIEGQRAFEAYNAKTNGFAGFVANPTTDEDRLGFANGDQFYPDNNREIYLLTRQWERVYAL